MKALKFFGSFGLIAIILFLAFWSSAYLLGWIDLNFEKLVRYFGVIVIWTVSLILITLVLASLVKNVSNWWFQKVKNKLF